MIDRFFKYTKVESAKDQNSFGTHAVDNVHGGMPVTERQTSLKRLFAAIGCAEISEMISFEVQSSVWEQCARFTHNDDELFQVCYHLNLQPNWVHSNEKTVDVDEIPT